MTPRAQRLAAEAAARTARGPYANLSQCPNAPCGRCARVLDAQWCGALSTITEHHSPRQGDPRVTKVDLCPRCYEDLIEWLDHSPI